MKNLLQCSMQKKKQYLMEELLKFGIYKKDDKHLYELPLSDLEEAYKVMEQNYSVSPEESITNNSYF